MAGTSRKKLASSPDARVEKIGRAAARLHRLLKDLGYGRNLEKSAATMPDARERLSYIDRAMHEASEKTISAVEASSPITAQNRSVCANLAERLSDTAFSEHQALIQEVVSQLGEIAAGEEKVHHNLLQIMEAQEFRDVAGQMVNKIVDAAQEIESILLNILKEYVPDTRDSLISKEGLTTGPEFKPGNSVSGQDEVDDLLASLGL